MKRVTAAALLHLCFYATAAATPATVSGSADSAVNAAPGDVARLPCRVAANAAASLTTWVRDGREVAGGSQRLTVLHDGSLNIQRVRAGDEGTYLCKASLPNNRSVQARVLLRVEGSPDNLTISVGPATALANGTLISFRGSAVTFNCSGSSYPSQQLTWAFRGPSSSNDSLCSTSGSWLDFRIANVQPSAQGVYSCVAQDAASHQAANKSTELLVYYVPDRHPECTWAPAQDPAHIMFNCTWFGAYPTPTLRWREDGGVVLATELTDSLSVVMNRSQLSSWQTVRCVAQHLALAAGADKSCFFTLVPPLPEGELLTTALEATSVTLTCTEDKSKPPASTTWRRGLQQEDIVPGSKYALTQEGAVLKLTIHNVSKDDEGVYFCRSENPLAIQELEVYLTVRRSAAYTGVIIGVFIAALIMGSAVIIAKTVYSSRHRICLGRSLGQIEEDRGDVLSLVESDDEQIFQDAVPRLPPLTNGRHTTLVQIHRIPSSDQEDAETAVMSPQQQEDTTQTEEPVELVTL